MAVDQNDIEMLREAIKSTMSESAVAHIGIILKGIGLFNRNVNTEIQWFANQLIDMLAENPDNVIDNADDKYIEELIKQSLK